VRKATPNVATYLSEIGRKGGKRSRRVLQSELAKEMIRVREAGRMFRRFHDQCLKSAPADLEITWNNDVDWVAEQLRKHGGKAGWVAAQRLCR
jgi:hypothetical protein